MIAIIDLPLRATHKLDGHDVLLIGIATRTTRVGETSSESFAAICVDQDGDVVVTPLEEVNVNWRFDDKRRKWLDVDTGEDLEDGESPD